MPIEMRFISPELTCGGRENRASRSPRSEAGAVVQAACNAGDYSIDLQIEPEFETGEVALVGQIVSRTGSRAPLSGAVVRLASKRKQLAAGESNSNGEFCLVARLQRGLRLYVERKDAGLWVGIPLDRLTAGFVL